MARTYLPKLVLLAQILLKYSGRWYDQICANCSPSAKTELDAALVALQGLVSAINLLEGD